MPPVHITVLARASTASSYSTQPSQPARWSHSRGRAAESSPSTIQLDAIEAKPSGWSTVGSDSSSSSLTRSRPRPLSRKMRSFSGEIAKGGFETTRSKRSPATGSRKLPSRSSTLSAPFSAQLNSANASARSLTSVATTAPACLAASTAWIPLPVPTSSARSMGLRIVSDASVADARATSGT